MSGLLFVALASGRVSVEYAIIGSLILLVVLGVVEPSLAFHGFSDPAVILLGGLFVIASGVTETGAMGFVLGRVLGRPNGVRGATARMAGPVALLSAFMNNTPIVAVFIPVVQDWCKRLGIHPSRLLMPLSFAAILGGTCTLIGTASNVIITGEYNRYVAGLENGGGIGLEPLSGFAQMWWVSSVGLPVTVVGLLFLIFIGPRLLPHRESGYEVGASSKEFTLEMEVGQGSTVVGKTIETAGLRQLPGLYLAEVQRTGELMSAPGPEVTLLVGDVLVFVGDVDGVVDLRKIRGLKPATDQVQKVSAQRRQRRLIQAVVSHRSPKLLRRSVRETRFRTHYNAAIIAVHRSGERVRGKIGDIRLQAGDVLLLEAGHDFERMHGDSPDFHLVSRVEGSGEIAHERAPFALGVVCLFVLLLTSPVEFGLGGYRAAVVSVFCACLMIGLRCTTTTIARRTMNWQVLLAVAGALGIGSAISASGAGEVIATGLIGAAEPLGIVGVLLVLFVVVNLVTQLVTNAAAAALMFPIVMAASVEMGAHPAGFALTLVMATACSFATPIGYQTNLMVVGPGGYRPVDFLRLGVPLTLIAGLVTVFMVYLLGYAEPLS